MSNNQRLGLMAAILSAVVIVAAGCAFVIVTPETATNEVGTTHSVTATLGVDFDPCQFVICEAGDVSPQAPGENVSFEVVEGPNAGEHSDGDCGPNGDQLCFISTPGQSVTWTYLSNGDAGIDYIQVCLIEDNPLIDQLLTAAAEETGLTKDEVAAMLAVSGQSAHDTEINEPEPDEGCDIVSKVWVDPTPTPTATPPVIEDEARPSRPNIGAGLSGLFAGQPTALPTAVGPASAPVAPSQTIRPPSTGDAGLR